MPASGMKRTCQAGMGTSSPNRFELALVDTRPCDPACSKATDQFFADGGGRDTYTARLPTLNTSYADYALASLSRN
jgi:hypothetical protein